jgi:hypothetical protein
VDARANSSPIIRIYVVDEALQKHTYIYEDAVETNKQTRYVTAKWARHILQLPVRVSSWQAVTRGVTAKQWSNQPELTSQRGEAAPTAVVLSSA